MSQVVKLTVTWPEIGTTITIKVPKNATPPQACVLVLKEFGKDPSEAEQFGLLRKSSHGGFNIWLKAEATLGALGLKTGEVLEFARRKRLLKIRLIDGNEKSIKTVQIDESHTLGEIVKDVCHRIGIQNHEEYSFSLEEDAVPLMRSQSTKKGKESLAELRKRLAEEEKWLQHELTLREQGIFPDTPLVLRKKFFFSDQEINKDDPVQINLLYGQSKDSILNGEHPCTLDEAVLFAAMQVHVENGNYNADRHKPGYIDNIRSYIPAEYAKTKGVEKLIYPEYKKLLGQTELNVKYKYITMCRSLKTYGITFYTVREKAKGKNKLVTRLLGITRESVMRMDEKTKEVLRTWPLTTVKRWVSSPNSFTLDFGGYSDYYSCNTYEGEKISELIAGYIDIILKKRVKSDKRNQGVQMASSSFVSAPEQGQVAAVNVHQHQAQNMAAIRGESMKARPRLRSSAQAQSVMVSKASKAIRKITLAKATLQEAKLLKDLGNSASAQQWKEDTVAVTLQNISAMLAAIVTSTASILTNTSARADRKKSNFTAVSSGIATISSNSKSLAEEMATLCSLLPASKAAYTKAGEELFEAEKDFISALNPSADGAMNRGAILSTATTLGQAASQVLVLTKAGDPQPAVTEQLLALAKAIAASTSTLVGKAKAVAGVCQDAMLQTSVISAAKTSALSTTQLATCAKLLAPVIQNPSCQSQLQESARILAYSIETLVGSAQSACKDEAVLSELANASVLVSNSLNEFLGFLDTVNTQLSDSTSSSTSTAKYDDACAAILTAADNLQLCVGDTRSMVGAAKSLAKATAIVVAELKAIASKETDPAKQQRALKMARLLADGTTRLVECTKKMAQNPKSKTARQELLAATNELKSVMKTTAGATVTRSAIKRVVIASKQCAAAATQLLGVVHSMDGEVTVSEKLTTTCAHVRHRTALLIKGLKTCKKDPSNVAAQLDLVSRASHFLVPAQRAAELARSTANTIHDAAHSLQLTNVSTSLNAALANLKGALENTAEVAQDVDITTAIESILATGSSLGHAAELISSQQLTPLPDTSAQGSSREIVTALRLVKGQMNQLIVAVHEGKEGAIKKSAAAIAQSLKNLESAVMTYASTDPSADEQREVLSATRIVMQQAAQMLITAKKAVDGAQGQTVVADDGSKRVRVAAELVEGVRAGKADVTSAMTKLVGFLPGQKDIASSIKSIEKHAAIYDREIRASVQGPEYFSHQARKLEGAAKNLNGLVNEVSELAIQGDPRKLAEASAKLTAAHKTFVMQGVSLASGCATQEEVAELIAFMKPVTLSTEKVLDLAAKTAANPHGSASKTQLTSAVREFAFGINNLLSNCSEASPGQKQCDHAIRTITAGTAKLSDPTTPVTGKAYGDNADAVRRKAEELGSALALIASTCKERNISTFSDAIEAASESVVALCDGTAQAAFLVTAGDSAEASKTGKGSVNRFAAIHSKEVIAQAAVVIANPTSTQQQVMAAAKKLATESAQLCTLCSTAAESVGADDMSSQQLVDCSKQLSATTSKVIEVAKAIATSGASMELRQQCRQHTGALIGVIDAVVQVLEDIGAAEGDNAEAEKGQADPNIFTEEMKARQTPFTQAGQRLATLACEYISTAKGLIANAQDSDAWNNLGEQSQQVSTAVDSLLRAFKDNAPGQIECDNAKYQLNELTQELENTVYACRTGSLEVGDDGTLSEYQEEIVGHAATLREVADALVSSSTSDPQLLGHAADGVRGATDPLLTAIVGFVSHLKEQEAQLALCDTTKTVLECAAALIEEAKQCGGDRENKIKHRHVARARDDLASAITELTSAIAQHTTLGVADGQISNINRALDKLELEDVSDYSVRMGFVEYQEAANNHARKLCTQAQEIVGKALSNPKEVSRFTNDLTNQLLSLISDTTGALNATSFSSQLKAAVRQLGNECSSLVETAALLHQRPHDSVAQKEVSNAAKMLVRQANTVVAQLQLGSQGVQSCIEASHAVESVVTDLETTLMFASAGTFFVDGEPSFAEEKQKAKKSAKALVEATKLLVLSNDKSQEELSRAADLARKEFDGLAESLRACAGSLPNDQLDAQILVLNSARDVGNALTDLLASTKSAYGKHGNDDAITKLSNDAKAMASSISTLLQTVGSIENESDRVAHALRGAIQAITKEKTQSSLAEDDFKTGSAQCIDSLVSASRPVTSAVSKLVSAISSGAADKLTQAANESRKAVVDLVQFAEVASVMTDAGRDSEKVYDDAKACATAVANLLQLAVDLNGKPPASDSKKAVLDCSRQVAKSLAGIGESAQILKGSETDEEDPNVVAEQELLTAASAIDNAVKKLAELQSQKEAERAANATGVNTLVPEDMPFEEQILSAAHSVANASSALVRAACVAQKGVASNTVAEAYSDEAQWSSSLTSAAKLVAAATKDLCESANATVKTGGADERLVASAKQVSNSTAQLLVACKVKLDPDSPAAQRVLEAGNSVKRAADSLVVAAQQAIERQAEADVMLDERPIHAMRQEIEAVEAIVRQERELEMAKRQLAKIRASKYKRSGDSKPMWASSVRISRNLDKK